jgi:hypothetical protein
MKGNDNNKDPSDHISKGESGLVFG